jgi:hypothetical protein
MTATEKDGCMKGTFKHMVLAALPVVGLLATTSVASAHDDDWRSRSYYDRPADEHEAYHEDQDARHEDFHSMPHSKREHRRFHKAEKREHRALHRDLDNGWGGYQGRDSYGDRYSNRDGYRGRYGDNYYGNDWWR